MLSFMLRSINILIKPIISEKNGRKNSGKRAGRDKKNGY